MEPDSTPAANAESVFCDDWALLTARLCGAWLDDLRRSVNALEAADQRGTARLLHDSIARLREQITVEQSVTTAEANLADIISMGAPQ